MLLSSTLLVSRGAFSLVGALLAATVSWSLFVRLSGIISLTDLGDNTETSFCVVQSLELPCLIPRMLVKLPLSGVMRVPSLWHCYSGSAFRELVIVHFAWLKGWPYATCVEWVCCVRKYNIRCNCPRLACSSRKAYLYIVSLFIAQTDLYFFTAFLIFPGVMFSQDLIFLHFIVPWKTM